jgi:hypothetical protein
MENISSPIGLLLRIDGPSGGTKSLEFDNMQEKGIKGNSGWVLYSVKLPLPMEGKAIYIGAINSGTGRLWVDDFQVLIDGVDINDARVRTK